MRSGTLSPLRTSCCRPKKGFVLSKEIILTRGFVALVDDWNYAWLNVYTWHEAQGYAVCNSSCSQGQKSYKVGMHRFILGVVPGDTRQIDHINRNTLDNREHNLRVCSSAENTCNQKLQVRVGTSRFKGVYQQHNGGSWRAKLGLHKGQIYLGSFSSEEEAARAYDRAALQHFGEFACTNESLGLFSL